MKSYTNKLFCFSPPVMLATFILEIGCLVYVLWRYKFTPVTRLASIILLLLATFQLAEFNVCQSIGVDPLVWSRVGYVAITLLPPVGIHLAYQLAGDKQRVWLWPAYLAAAAFVAFFVFIDHSLTGQACLGNYIIFQTAPGSDLLYGLYYYGSVMGGLTLGYKLGQKATGNQKRALYGLAIGYAAFLVPTTTANLLIPETVSGIPSIMCGFAVLFAFTITLYILPKYRNSSK